MVKKADVIMLISLVFISLLLFAVMLLIPKSGGDTLVVTVNGKEYCRAPLSVNTELHLENNTIIIENGYAYMKNADCPDKICINQGKINKIGQTVVCLPNSVILEVE